MKNSNIYWAVYKNIEKELLDVAYIVHIDDTQIQTYSVKLTELLLRIVVEIESISKELYYAQGGTKENDTNLYFDTDCIKHLNGLWDLKSKAVIVNSPYLFFDKNENLELYPFVNADKRGKCDWKKAYQAVKHSRNNNLKKGNIKHVIRALGALFILNLYYKQYTQPILPPLTKEYIAINCGSEIFSVLINRELDISDSTIILKQPEFDKCLLIYAPTKSSVSKLQVLYKKQEVMRKAEINKLTNIKAMPDIANPTLGDAEFEDVFQTLDEKTQKDIIRTASEISNNYYKEDINKATEALRFEVVMNCNQFS